MHEDWGGNKLRYRTVRIKRTVQYHQNQSQQMQQEKTANLRSDKEDWGCKYALTKCMSLVFVAWVALDGSSCEFCRLQWSWVTVWCRAEWSVKKQMTPGTRPSMFKCLWQTILMLSKELLSDQGREVVLSVHLKKNNWSSWSELSWPWIGLILGFATRGFSFHWQPPQRYHLKWFADGGNPL